VKIRKRLLEGFNDDRGMGVIEILVASVISLMVLGVAVVMFTRNQSILEEQNEATNIQAKARYSVDRIEEEIRMAGFGLPAFQGLTAIGANSISFRSNLDDVRTTTPPCNSCPGTIAGSTGDTTLTVVDESGFSSGDKIVIHDPNFSQWELNTVTGTSAGTLSLGAGLAHDYVYGINTSLVTVNKYNDITIALSGTNIIRTVDGAATNLVSDVDATNGLVFNFYGISTPSSILRLGFALNLIDPGNPGAAAEFKTDISLRNS